MKKNLVKKRYITGNFRQDPKNGIRNRLYTTKNCVKIYPKKHKKTGTHKNKFRLSV